MPGIQKVIVENNQDKIEEMKAAIIGEGFAILQTVFNVINSTVTIMYVDRH